MPTMIFQNLIIKYTKIWDGLSLPILNFILRALFIGLLIIHFSILFIHQLPENPIKHQFKHSLHNYVDPFFSQAWTLFAPNPISSNMSLLMRFEYKERKAANVTEWMDITEPMIVDRKNNFWSPAQRISKFTQSCMSNINDNHKLILEQINKIDTLKNDTVKSKIFYRNAINTTYGHRSIIQYSKYISRNYFNFKKINASNIKLQYRILNARFPRFSKRNEDYYNLDNYEFTELTSEFIPTN